MAEIKNNKLAGALFALIAIANLTLAALYIPVLSENSIEFLLNLIIGMLAGVGAIMFFKEAKNTG